MGRRRDICPGKENNSYRDAWDNFDELYEAWLEYCKGKAESAADTLDTLPKDDDARHEVLAGLELPQPPLEPDAPCTLGSPVWCNRCQRHIAAALTDIGDLASVLAQWADGHRGAASGERIISRRTNAPSPSPITDTLDELYGALAQVEADWREARGHRPRPNRARTGDARERTLAYLAEHLADILAHPGSAAFGRAALAWQRRLQKLTRTDPVVRKQPGRCPRCGIVNVLQSRDDGYTECRSCGRLMTEKEYEQVVATADVQVVAESQAERQAS